MLNRMHRQGGVARWAVTLPSPAILPGGLMEGSEGNGARNHMGDRENGMSQLYNVGHGHSKAVSRKVNKLDSPQPAATRTRFAAAGFTLSPITFLNVIFLPATNSPSSRPAHARHGQAE